MGRLRAFRHLTVLVVGMAACEGAADSPPAATAVPVTLAPVVRDSLVDEIVLTGRLTPVLDHDAVLNAPAAGVVRRVTVQLGMPVRPGQVLVELEVPELVATARQQTVSATQAHREAARQRQLLVDGVTSRRQVEEAEAAAHAADAAAASSRRLLAQTRVASPIAGRVQQIAVSQGMRVEPGARLAEVIASDTLDLSAPVTAARLARMNAKRPVRVTADGDVTAYPGWVEALAPAVDSLTNAGRVLIRVPNPAGRLRAGTGASGRVALDVRRGVLVVPDSALVLVGGSPSVFVVGADSIASRRSVTVGVRQVDRVEVRGPLRAGDAVVVTGAAGLQDGMHVVPAGPPAAPGTKRP